MSVILKGDTELHSKYKEYIDKRKSIELKYGTARWGTYWDAEIALVALGCALVGSMFLPFYIGFIIGGLAGYTYMVEKKGNASLRESFGKEMELNGEYSNYMAGMAGEDAVTAALSPYNVFILNDVKISSNRDKKPVQIDHIVICPFGILCIETKNLKGGNYFTSAGNPEVWRGGTMEIYSPQKQVLGHVSVLAGKLRDSGIGNALELIKPVVVLTNSTCKYSNLSTYYDDVPVLKLAELSDYMKDNMKKVAVLRPEVQRRIGNIIKLLCENC